MEIGKNIDVKKRREKGLVCTETMSRQRIVEMSSNKREQKVYLGRCTNREEVKIAFFKKIWAIPGLFFLYFRLFNTQLTVNKRSI